MTALAAESISSSPPAASPRCRDCGTELAQSLLSCPVCQRLVHADELKRLAAEAEAATNSGRLTDALVSWRTALDLLPVGTGQHARVAAAIDDLSRRVDAQPSFGGTPSSQQRPNARVGSIVAAAGTLALLSWKFKAVLLILLSKGKLLLLGLTKMSTLGSMLLSFGVYWSVWGWKFAAGLIVSIYVHEMGHIAALRRFGIRSSAPAFIPGFGALVRLKQSPANPVEDARVGLAGPLWGLVAALLAYAVFLATGWASWAAIARVGAWINLFNLLPMLPLDGGRGFRALSRFQRWAAAATLGAAWLTSGEGLLVLLLLVAVVRAFGNDGPRTSDRMTLAQYVFLVVALSALTMIDVPHAPAPLAM